MADFTATQGRYLSYIDAYTRLHGFPPAEAEIATAMCVSPPSVNQMVKTLEKRGLIERRPGESRTIRVLVPENEIATWNKRGSGFASAAAVLKKTAAKTRLPAAPAVPTVPAVPATPANIYVLSVALADGPVTGKFAGKPYIRVIEIRGDQTLAELHRAVFDAFDRWEEHLYEFQFGERPMDPKGPRYGIADGYQEDEGLGDAKRTPIDDLELKPHRIFGYWFDFGDSWYHQIEVVRIDKAIPTVTYPRVVKRTGQSPPQYADD